MKISKEEALAQGKWTAAKNPFTKAFVDDDDCPKTPPEEMSAGSDDGSDPKKPNKFERLMKAACSIKTAELDLRKKKFELLPAFLKAGVYYTTKLDSIRK